MKEKRSYDPDFKREAVRLVIEEGLRIGEVERNLGITAGVLKGWVRKHRKHQDAVRGRNPGIKDENLMTAPQVIAPRNSTMNLNYNSDEE